MEFKGTKGKWSIAIVPDYIDTLPSAMLEIQGENFWVCKVQNKGKIGNYEGRANAQLISKAPEMLEMIDRMRQILIGYAQAGYETKTGSEAIQDCNNLLKQILLIK